MVNKTLPVYKLMCIFLPPLYNERKKSEKEEKEIKNRMN